MTNKAEMVSRRCSTLGEPLAAAFARGSATAVRMHPSDFVDFDHVE